MSLDKLLLLLLSENTSIAYAKTIPTSFPRTFSQSLRKKPLELDCRQSFFKESPVVDVCLRNKWGLKIWTSLSNEVNCLEWRLDRSQSRCTRDNPKAFLIGYIETFSVKTAHLISHQRQFCLKLWQLKWFSSCVRSHI